MDGLIDVIYTSYLIDGSSNVKQCKTKPLNIHLYIKKIYKDKSQNIVLDGHLHHEIAFPG